MFKQQYSIFFIILLALILGGCSGSYRSAMVSYEIGEYHGAIQKMQKASKREKDPKVRLDIDHKIAESYWYIGDHRRAEPRFRNLINRQYPDSLLSLKYAHALRYNGNYTEAIKYYNLFLELFPENGEALNGIESCKVTPEWEKTPTRFVVTHEKILNTRDAEYSPVFIAGLDNALLFTSTRDGAKGRKRSQITGHRNGDLWRANFDIQRQRWDKPQLLEEDLMINTPNDEGAATLSSDGSLILFTRCRFDKGKAMGAQIFESQKSKDTWSEATALSIGGDSLIIAHPSLSRDGQTLYFVSDMPGGFGGKDIWKVEKTSEAWSEPINLGPEINTPGNEMFPFIRDNGELYFSSDYHIGMGGYDIFRAYYSPTGLTVENMKAPINSTGDDFSIFFLPGKDQGMFASNRKGSLGDDLYSFVLPPKIYRTEGEIVNTETDTRIKDAYLRVIGTDGTNLKVRSEDGKFQFRMMPGTEYIFAAFKEGFLNSKQIVSTIGLEDSKMFTVNLRLTPTDSPINVENINYEFAKFDLLPESVSALDSLIATLELNPTIVVEIMAHTDFVGSAQFNSDLSQKRAQSVVNYLITKGINPARLVAKGYGETWPKKVTRKLAKDHDFLKANDVLTEDFINKLATDEQKEIAKSLCRRTEFRVLSNDFRE
jgi:peptidoglycan-associated lipoprotein